ncbi:MAG: choice-of-anchor J domain-containing protein [Muribaculaceae bacterium]|nr:choice-of-anchor J domain-containing protein [Muribaculaceae bacterium]
MRLIFSLMGGAAIAAAAVGIQPTAPSNAPARSADSPVGHVYTIFSGGLSGDGYMGDFGTINLSDGTVTSAFSSTAFINTEPQLQCGAMRGNILYIPEFSQNEVTGDLSVFWKVFDTSSRRRLDNINFSVEDFAYCYALTYDSDRDMFYGLAVDLVTYGFNQLIEINPNDWSTRHIGNVGNGGSDFMASLVYNPVDQQLYGIKTNGIMYMVDRDNASYYEVKVFEDYEDFVIPRDLTSQYLIYSPQDHCFVTIYPNNTERVYQLAYINVADGSFDVYDGEPLPQGYMFAGLYCTDQYAPDNAPAQPVLTALEFDGPSLTGDIAFKAPESTFDGSPISGNVEMIITIDGDKVWSDNVEPGAAVKAPVTVSEGLHNVAVFGQIDGVAGPKDTYTFYAGHDTSIPPSQVSLDGALLYWSKPSASVNGGYIDMTYMTYDVYVDGERINEEPIANPWYTLDITGDMRRVAITVTATANGHVSEPSAPLSVVLGSPLELPVTFEPTRAETELFTVVNTNNDENEFAYYEQDGKSYIAVGSVQYYQQPDDWFFLPAIALDDIDARYSISFEYSNYYGAADHNDDLEIHIGTYPLPESMSACIYSHANRQTAEDTEVNADFGITQPGVYYIGFHTNASGAYRYRGVKMRNFRVALDEAASALAPGNADDLTIEAAPLGALKATARFTAPVKAVNDTPLDMNEPITFVLDCGANLAQTEAMPGQEVSLEIEVPENGMQNFFLTPSTASQGKGVAQLAKAYVGIDIPLYPANVQLVASRDNKTFTLSWEAPVQGEHNGYVDTDGLVYNIYLHNNLDNVFLGTTSECSYDVVYTGANQQNYYLGVLASNEAGQSLLSPFVSDFIGPALPVPVSERFGYTGFDCGPWMNNTEGDFGNCLWSSVNSLDGFGIGDPVVSAGALACFNMGNGPGRGELISPKMTTDGVDKAMVNIRYWQYAHAASMQLWGRTAENPEYTMIADLTPGSDQKWADWNINLPESFMNQGWIQFRLRAILPDYSDAYCLVDRFEVLRNVEHDFAMQSLTGPESVVVGDDAVFNVNIVNSGIEMGTTSIVVDVLGDGNVIASETVNVGRTDAGRSFERNFTFPMLVEYLAYNDMQVRASIVSDDDEVEHNNTAAVSFVLADNVLPVVEDLHGSDAIGNGVELTWSRPDASYGSTEGFENMPSHRNTDMIGRWRNIDRDGGVPFAINGLSWSGNTDPGAWMVFDAEAMGTMNDSRLCPHSGKQYIMARSLAYDESEEPVQSSDWLISPRVEGGTTVSFWFGTIDSSYPETIGVWVSETDDDISSFTMLQPFTKSGGESWEKVRFTLPDNARYFAFEYRSWGAFAAMIDDIEFTPAELSEWDIDSYRVYVTNGNAPRTLVADKVTDTGYIHTDASTEGGAVYHVTTVVTDSEGNLYEGPLSNAAFIDGNSVDKVNGSLRIAGGRGNIYVLGAEADNIAIYTTDGKLYSLTNCSDGTATIPVEPGIYVVKVGNTVAKVRVL